MPPCAMVVITRYFLASNISRTASNPKSRSQSASASCRLADSLSPILSFAEPICTS